MNIPGTLANVIKPLPLILLLFILLTAIDVSMTAAADFTRQRQHMVGLIEDDVRETSIFIGMNTLNPDVMKAMGTVKRHEFVPEYQKRHAYENRPLAIGYGQTISQPYVVALMTNLLNISPNSRILEVGTGSGYQAAILATLANRVYSIEIIEPLGQQAKKRLERLQFANVQTKIGDGYYGWQEHAPFDAIIVTAAANHVPPPLLQQLKPGGRMVIPVGSRFLPQQLLLVIKDDAGKVTTRQVLYVRFVPLTGAH